MVRPVHGAPVGGVAGRHLHPHALHQVLFTITLLLLLIFHSEQPHSCHACTLRMIMSTDSSIEFFKPAEVAVFVSVMLRPGAAYSGPRPTAHTLHNCTWLNTVWPKKERLNQVSCALLYLVESLIFELPRPGEGEEKVVVFQLPPSTKIICLCHN